MLVAFRFWISELVTRMHSLCEIPSRWTLAIHDLFWKYLVLE